MKISKAHQALSTHLNNPEVLTNPELFLGPNWETVLRWWLYYESLTYDQLKELNCRYYDNDDDDTQIIAYNLAYGAAIEVIGVDNRSKVYRALQLPAITYELIAMHLLLERGHQLTFVPLIKDL
jgi:hypothetical protein